MKTKALILLSTLVLVGIIGTGCVVPGAPTAPPAAEAPAAAEPAQTEAPESVTIRWGIYADPGRFKAAEAQVAAFQEAHPNI